jgi:hypothetical protein
MWVLKTEKIKVYHEKEGNGLEHSTHRTFCGRINIKRGSWGAWCESQVLPSTEGNNYAGSQNREN